VTVAAAAAGPGPAIVAFELTAVPSGPTEVRRLDVRNKCKYASLSPASRWRHSLAGWQAGGPSRGRFRDPDVRPPRTYAGLRGPPGRCAAFSAGPAGRPRSGLLSRRRAGLRKEGSFCSSLSNFL
jgi:hypothetical protein